MHSIHHQYINYSLDIINCLAYIKIMRVNSSQKLNSPEYIISTRKNYDTVKY